jgi:hypothetical protein
VKWTSAALAVVAALGALGLATAGAQPIDGPPIAYGDGPSPYEIVGIVRANGFRPLGPPLRRGRVYVVHAMEPRGDDVRIVVDALSGRILSVAALDAPAYAGPAYPGPAYEAMDEPAPPYMRGGQYRYGPPERMTTGSPPDRIPPGNAAPAAPVTRSAAVTPPRTPLPRPRPVDKAVASPADLNTAQPTPTAQTSQAPANDASAAKDRPAEKPADKPAGNSLPPVTPLE